MKELRSSPRTPYKHEQMIAPIDNGRLPSQKDFFPVSCHNISAGGLSFTLDHRPEFERLVVVLGKPNSLNTFFAHVVHVSELKNGGVPKYRVGCQFDSRVL